MEPRIKPINEYLEEKIAHFERRASTQTPSAKSDWEDHLDQLLRSALQEVWN